MSLARSARHFAGRQIAMGVLRGLGRAVGGLVAGLGGLVRGVASGVGSLLRRLF